MSSGYRYLLAYTVPLTVWVALFAHGALTFLPLFVYFGLVPVLELGLTPRRANLDAAARRDAASARRYDAMLYAVAPFLLATLALFVVQVQEPGLTAFEIAGRTVSMGLMCGILGVNAGHELGHRKQPLARLLGDVCMLSALQNHFAPYHNRGHHRNVATPDDPATARRNEPLYAFWWRSHSGSWMQAWRIERDRLATLDVPATSVRRFVRNRMVVWTGVQIVVLGAIALLAGPLALAGCIGAAIVGTLLLETVNYIEHYGLVRERDAQGRYERVRHHHSWNSDHPVGRTLLFELSRHSDHHYKAGKHYQLLDSLDRSPQMPTGYPGMMLLAAVPPLWYRTMHPRIDGLRDTIDARSSVGAPA